MRRHFFIFTAANEKCTVKEGGIETTHEFSDILAAISYVHGARRGEEVDITSYDPTGQVVFTRTV